MAAQLKQIQYQDENFSEGLYSLHKHWIRANLMSICWRNPEENRQINNLLYQCTFAPLKNTNFYQVYEQRWHDSIQHAYFTYLIASISCVMEGYKKLPLRCGIANPILTNLYDYLYEPVNNYRNCTWHFETDINKKNEAKGVIQSKLLEIIKFHNMVGGILLKIIPALKLVKDKPFSIITHSSTINDSKEQSIKGGYQSFSQFINFIIYWERATLFRNHFYMHKIKADYTDFDALTYMDYWYAAIYSLIEGYQKLSYHDGEIDSLLNLADDTPYWVKLKSYRHSICHYEKTYHNQHLKRGFLISGTAKWINRLSDAFNNYILKELLKIEIQDKIIKSLYLG